MNPTFCTYRENPGLADIYFTDVAAAHGLGERRPGLAVAGEGEIVDVIVSADGRIEQIPRQLVDMALPETLVLALMDAIEEAIEDALEAGPDSGSAVEQMEASLSLMERASAAL